MENAQLTSINGYIREKAYFATALSEEDLPCPEGLKKETEQGILYPFVQRNKVSLGESAEMISPKKIGRAFLVTELYDETGAPIEAAPHPSMRFFARVPFAVSAGDIMRAGE